MTYTSTDSSDQTEVKSWTLFLTIPNMSTTRYMKREKGNTLQHRVWENAVAFQWNPPTLLALELLWWMEVSWWARAAGNHWKHEPFQQCCNTVSFWFKHTLTNAKCTHYQILPSAFPRTTGESEQTLQILRVALTPPTLFPNDSLRTLLASPFFLQKYSVVTSVLHSCSFPTKPLRYHCA